MTKKTKPLDGIDLKEFQRQRELVKQHAVQEIADKVEQIKTLLREIRDINDVAEVGVDLRDVFELVDDVDTENDWNSSSLYC